MNTREQYLLKQNERLQAQLQVVLAAMNNAVEESEFRASVACAFAWDLAASLKGFYEDPGDLDLDTIESLGTYVEAEWDAAVAKMESK